MWLLAVALLVAGCASSPDPSTPDPAADESAPQDDGQDEEPAASPEPEPDPDEPEETVDEEPAEPAVDPAEVGADELGLVPVLMYHQLLEDGGSQFDLAPDELRAELTYLFDEGYVPIRTVDLARGEIDVPAGRSPVVLTFDDSTRSQAWLDDDGEIDPESAIGILIEVAADYDDVEPLASLYVITSSLFGGREDGPDIVAALHDLGMEVGNHTHGHGRLDQLDDAAVQEELARNVAEVRAIAPDAEVATLSLPLGIFPENRDLLPEGSSDSGDYRNEGVLLVGAEPAPSPFHRDFDPVAIPRILSSPDPELVAGSAWWFELLEAGGTHRRYVSDGNPDTISFPAEHADALADEFEDRANPY